VCNSSGIPNVCLTVNPVRGIGLLFGGIKDRGGGERRDREKKEKEMSERDDDDESVNVYICKKHKHEK
jgi:hypothetical protein